MARGKTAPLHRGVNRIDVVISEFGREVTQKLRTQQGSQEDHLRGPFERMLRDIAISLGLKVTPIGETRLPDLSIRPDYAINVAGARVGYVELKRPNYGLPSTWKRPSAHDKRQWEQLKLLPNVLYSDGQSFGRYKFGKLQGRIARLEPGLDRAGERLRPVDNEFARVVTDFLLWEPEQPRRLDELIHLVANLCRLLRDDVAAELTREQTGESTKRIFTGLADDWRRVLFPNLSDKEFADQYAQTVTFALLLARVEGVSFQNRSIGEIARLLGKKHSLMGKALAVLTNQSEEDHSIALITMMRVVSVVDWSYFPEDSYAMLYEHFLERYDSTLRRKSGVYYTPARIVSFMTRFVDDILSERLGRRLGFAEEDVIVVDPAMGTGSFLAEVINRVATTVSDEEGPGVVTPRLRELSNRLIGFENQAAPYAVAELRIHSLLKKRHRAEIPLKERRFLADTLDDPDAQMLPIGSLYDTIKQVRDDANFVKRQEPVMVVIGNPPYLDKVKGIAPWIEFPSDDLTAAPSINAFRKAGNGKREYVLANKYVYFWRWATWKVFDAHRDHPPGIVALICSAGFISGPGFAGMREYLRRTADEGWIIDLSPEGHQPPMNTRAFRGNQQPICIAFFIRRGEVERRVPAHIHRTSVSGAFDDKCVALQRLKLNGPEWADCASGWCDPFWLPEAGPWHSIPTMTQLMPWASPGVKPNRTWVYAPSEAVLRKRWQKLVSASPDDKAPMFKESRDANLIKVNPPLVGAQNSTTPFLLESGKCPDPIAVGYRSFDRQWIIPDSRIIATPRAALWASNGPHQIFVIEQHAHRIRNGPALVFTNLLPDNDHFMGHHGGRVLPLYRDAEGAVPNISPNLLVTLCRKLGVTVTALDMLAYIAAVAAHPGYTQRFQEELSSPGVRIPLTADTNLWLESVTIGQEILWLHSYGECCVDSQAGRPRGAPRMRSARPKVRVTIPDAEDRMPDEIDYDAESLTLKIGAGRISPVGPSVWNYQVSGMRIIRHWFGYRKKNPSGSRQSALDRIVARTWTPAMTTELLDLLNVLGRCVTLEPRQTTLLEDVMTMPLISVAELEATCVLPVPSSASAAPKVNEPPGLWSVD
ncbi:MAG TPA: type ISP restriction/modification enzyme [Actinophytocola sp.]|uniref:type ISP restriction/modification enzyme n=1 Tax=Actinophytocola sp. TaxID=1872138 RepID=UPI002DBD9531|nr:type ISP restriction/modification enzyme [Actinophytocola sp.]HEU5475176.1 type ISP restriction/modification enzyme [Actinophytocola sp.]